MTSNTPSGTENFKRSSVAFRAIEDAANPEEIPNRHCGEGRAGVETHKAQFFWALGH
jgi:hypothetical protein